MPLVSQEENDWFGNLIMNFIFVIISAIIGGLGYLLAILTAPNIGQDLIK